MKKETEPRKLRKHQIAALRVAKEIADGKRLQRSVVAGITPGGGKTLMASLFANQLADDGAIDRVLVVVPNDPLRQQMIDSFHDHDLGLHRILKAPSSQRTIPGTGVPFGQVVTYQRLTDPREAKRLASWCAKAKTLVIFDEVHHLCDDQSWQRGAEIVKDACKLLLCMSGTLWRWDEGRIPFVNYDSDNKALIDVRYSRDDALRERAVLPVEFRFFDGSAIYEHRLMAHETSLSTAPTKEQPRALKTALMSPEYAEQFLIAALEDWERYRVQYGYASSAIVVCHDQKRARAALAVVRARFTKHSSALSLHNEPNSDKAIKKFRAGDHSILITVKKAYEGLDVPSASHLVYLHDIRSWPFLDQVIARVTRFNKDALLPWEDQRGHVYVPDDRRIREYVDNMLNEQVEFFRERVTSPGFGAEQKRSSFRPGDSEVTGVRRGFDGRRLSDEENAGVDRLVAMHPSVIRASTPDQLELARKLGLVPLAPGETAHA